MTIPRSLSFDWLVLSWVPMPFDALVEIDTFCFFEAGLTKLLPSSTISLGEIIKICFARIVIWSTRHDCKGSWLLLGAR